MKYLVLIILSLTISIMMYGQDTLTFYYKSNEKLTSKVAKAKYEVKVTKNGDKFHMSKTLIESNTILQESELKTWEPFVEEGLTEYFDGITEKYVAKGYYHNGLLDSLWSYRKNDGSYDSVSYSGIDPDKKYISKKETFYMVEQMPVICNYEYIIKQRKTIDKSLSQLNKTNNETYLELQKQIIDLNRQAFDRYKTAQLCYPIRAKNAGKKGIVYASFVIDELGKTDEIVIVRGVDKDLDREAIRLIKALPIGSAGKQRGKAVRVGMTVGVGFE